MNSDCFGWVSITGTNINYPVMHTPDNPQKYLNKNFYGEYSLSGVPFLDGRCTSTSTNLIIYGHHMNNGTMFAELCNYTNTSYRDEHKAVALETKGGVSAYTVFAVLKVKSDDEWYRFTSALTEKRYNSLVEYAKEKSIYETGIAPKYGQQILTLSTCYGYNQDDRILVLAVREYPPSTEEQAILSQLAERNGVTLRIYHRLVESMEQRKIIQNATRKNKLKSSGNDVNETIEAQGNLQDVVTLMANLRKNKEALLHCSAPYRKQIE